MEPNDPYVLYIAVCWVALSVLSGSEKGQESRVET
jgi:hypothetical protein